MKFSTALWAMMMMTLSTFFVVSAFVTSTSRNGPRPITTLHGMVSSENELPSQLLPKPPSSTPPRNIALSVISASVLAVGTLGGMPSVTLPNIYDQQQQESPTVVSVVRSLTGVPSAYAATPTTAAAVTSTGGIDMKKLKAATTTSKSSSTTTTSTTTTATKVSNVMKKQPQPQLSKEERERLDSKKYLDLCQQSLKEYQKYVNEISVAAKQADNIAQASIKQASQAKAAYIKQSDKLSKAKNERMPNSAIQELQRDAGTYGVIQYWLIFCSLADWNEYDKD
jgi:hypothetical protein